MVLRIFSGLIDGGRPASLGDLSTPSQSIAALGGNRGNDVYPGVPFQAKNADVLGRTDAASIRRAD